MACPLVALCRKWGKPLTSLLFLSVCVCLRLYFFVLVVYLAGSYRSSFIYLSNHLSLSIYLPIHLSCLPPIYPQETPRTGTALSIIYLLNDKEAFRKLSSDVGNWLRNALVIMNGRRLFKQDKRLMNDEGP